MCSADQYKSNGFGIREEYDNVIRETRDVIRGMTGEERFVKAKSHIIDSLKNKQPRPISYFPELTASYYALYFIQSSLLWDWLTFFLAYLYMFLVILDNESYVLKLSLEWPILLCFFFDTFIDFYCKSFDKFKTKSRFPTFYYLKLSLLMFMAIDLIIFAFMPCYDTRPIRPFRILRACIPLLYDSEFRKSLLALGSAYKDLITFLIYYTIVIVGFAFIGSHTITYDANYKDPNFPEQFDALKTDYNSLAYMIYETYAIGTYDFYPDNQLLAIQSYEPNYLFFIVFIFFNLFLFTPIPGGLIYNKFRETRSKYIIVDEIKQQHSLILAFVTLAQDETNLSMETLIKFLFFFYKNKVRYVQYITEICMKLDDNNNQTIQVNEFMELSKLLLYNSVMYPPLFEDWQFWLNFRGWVNSTIYLKSIVSHLAFDIVTAIFTILAATNSLYFMATDSPLSKTFDSIFIWLFFTELVLKIVGLGPEKFFNERWNNIDAVMIVLNVVFSFASTGTKLDNFIKMFRFFRIIGLIRNILCSRYVTRKRIEIFQKLKRLFSTFLEIMPIILKFFNLFLFFFFVFSILGMEIFYDPEYYTVLDQTGYNNEVQFSNFNSFIHSQYVMMQVLTEGGWSYVGYDYCWRNPDYYGLIAAFFVLMHIVIIHITSTLIKGIFWEIYFTVSSMMNAIQERLHQQLLREEENEIKTQEINEINARVKKSESVDANTMIKRELIEMKLDNQILRRIKNFEFYDNDSSANSKEIRNMNRSKIVERIMENWNISAKELILNKKKTSFLINSQKLKKRKAMEFVEIEEKEEEDFELEMEELLNRLIISTKITYSEIIAYPRIFVDFLDSRFKRPLYYMAPDRFDMNCHPLYNEQSMSFHTYVMNNILGVESSTREKRNMIIECLLRNDMIDEPTAETILNTKHIIKKFRIDSNGVLRKMYLAETNEALVKKFEIEYFYNIYGNSFRKINKITLEPLLQFQATLMYTLWNIVRYPQIEMSEFFHLLTHLEDELSNKLIKTGSLVKFVYKIDHESDIWFLVEKKKSQEVKIRFIKTGLWVYTPSMEENKQYFAKDVFNWNHAKEKDEKMCEQYIKLFYQSFETLAFSLINKKSFFETNPREYVYDLYVENFELQKNARKASLGQLKISNIMLIILAKEEERLDVGIDLLPYQLSDLKSPPRVKKEEDFILKDDDTYEKLTNLQAQQEQKIIENEGLPFAYICNMMKQISDVMKIYSENFKGQVEKALNEKYNEINLTESSSDDNLISLPQVKVLLSEQD